MTGISRCCGSPDPITDVSLNIFLFLLAAIALCVIFEAAGVFTSGKEINGGILMGGVLAVAFIGLCICQCRR